MCNSLWIHFCHSYTKYAILSSMNSSYSNNFMYKGTWGCVILMLLLTSVIPMCKFSGDNLLLIYNSVWIYFWITPILKLLITHLLTKRFLCFTVRKTNIMITASQYCKFCPMRIPWWAGNEIRRETEVGTSGISIDLDLHNCYSIPLARWNGIHHH